MSLSEQLQKLQIPGHATDTHNISARDSLLFDVKTAATLNNEAIFNIGISGLEELISIDPLFGNFTGALFSKNALGIDRKMHNKKTNEKLQRKIDEFLMMLSPYLLLKPAQKTLEWMIRKFKVHTMDKSALMRCILPYHETQLFGRIVQLFNDKKTGDLWDWLIPCRKEGCGFNTQMLVKHALANMNFLSFICEMANQAWDILQEHPKIKSGFSLIFSFYARTLAAVIDTSPTMKEEVLSLLLPFIHSGLKSKHKEYVCATYMIVALISTKAALGKDLKKAILAAIAKFLEPAWYEEGVLCITSFMLHQNISKFSPRIFQFLLSLEKNLLVDVLRQIKREHKIDVFISCFLHVLADSVTAETELTERSSVLLVGITDNVTLSNKQIADLIRNMMDGFIKNKQNEMDLKFALDIIRTLAMRFSLIFDEIVSTYFNTFMQKKEKRSLKVLKKLISSCLSTTKHQLVDNIDLPLVLCLNHPKSAIRVAAVQQLFTTFQSDIQGYDDDFFKQAILARLADDCSEVVEEVLKFSKSTFKLLSLDEVLDNLMKLMQRSDFQFNLNSLMAAVLQNINNASSKYVDDFVYALLGQLFLTFSGKKNKKIMDALGDISTDNVILSGIKNAISHIPTKALSKSSCCTDTVVQAFNSLITHVADTIFAAADMIEVLDRFWSFQNKLPDDHDLHFVAIMIVTELSLKQSSKFLSKITTLSFERLFLRKMTTSKAVVEDFLRKSDHDDLKKKLFEKFLISMKSPEETQTENHMDLAFILFWRSLISQFTVDLQSSEQIHANLESKKSIFVVLAEESVRKESSLLEIYRSLLNLYFATCFRTAEEIVQFLSSIYITLLKYGFEKESDVKAGLCALHISTRFLHSVNEKESLLTDVLSSLLCLLTSPVSSVRKVAFKNIVIIHEKTRKDKKNLWNFLLQNVVNAENELVLDAKHFKRLLQSIYNRKANKRKSEFSGLMLTKSKTSKEDEKQLSSLKHFLLTLAQCPVIIKLCLVESLEFVDSKLLIEDFMAILKLLLKGKCSHAKEIKLICVLLKRMEPQVLNNDGALFDLFLQCFHSQCSSIQKTSFEMITTDFYDGLSFGNQLKLLEIFLKSLVASSSVMTATDIRIILQNVNIPTKHICKQVDLFCKEFDKNLKTINQRVEPNYISDEKDIIKSDEWQAVIELFEAIGNNDNADNPNELVFCLFDVLERCLQVQDTSVEYVKQLILSIINRLTKSRSFNLPEDKFKVELLIQCLQASTDIRTNQYCLQVLSESAKLYPTRVLHNVMHIFTFMGGTMLRLDNEHTFNIIIKTIDAVIPVLIKKDVPIVSRKRPSSSSVNEIVVFILQTFVDSIPYCPEHRRQHILKHLLDVLNIEEYLHTITLLLINKVIQRSARRKSITQSEDQEMELSPISLEFCKDFFSSYEISQQIHALHNIVFQMNSTFQPSKKSRKKIPEDLMFNTKEPTDKQLKLVQYTVIVFVIDVLRNEKLLDGYNAWKKQKQQQLTKLYTSLLEELLCYVETLSLYAEQKAEEQSTKYWHNVIQKTYDAVGQVYNLLPFDPFILIVSGLLTKKSQMVRKKSLELLCSKLSDKDELSEEQEANLLSLLDDIVRLIKPVEEEKTTGKEESAVNKQLMLYIIKLLANKLCAKFKTQFVNILPVVVQLYSIENCNQLVSINAVLCVAQLCSHLKDDVFPHLPMLMKPLLDKITDDVATEQKKSVLLLSSCVTALQKVLQCVPLFLSPFVPDILHKIAVCEMVCTKVKDDVFSKKVTSIKEDMGLLLPARVLLPAVDVCYDKLLDTNPNMLPTVIDVYRLSFKHISKADANVHYNSMITKLFKKIFDIRSEITTDDTILVKHIEDLGIQAFCDLVLKLSENTLRPLYLELFNWSTQSEEISKRLLVFFRLSVSLSNSLKSLFLLFIGHALNKAKDVLKNVNTMNQDFKEKNHLNETFYQELIGAVLDTLCNTFHFDTQGFMNKERFDSLMQELVDQLENEIYDSAAYPLFIKSHLSPCLVNLASAVNDTACWKPLNYQILLKTKSSNSQVRLAALQVMEEIYNRMGESYMVFVPETIPFLAEILEDDAYEVEQQCQRLIKQVEEITGESLQKYF